jgi:hypothetical protein
MDIVIDIQGFRDADEKFLPKEIAVVAIDAAIVDHWIIMPPCPFGELPEKVRRQNTWLTRNYHGIEWFDGEANSKYFTLRLREIIRYSRHIYVRGNEKAYYLRNLLSREIYNLEDISPAFKNLTAEGECGQYCTHHGFRKIFHCALHNACKLKRWLLEQNNSVSSDSLSVTQTTSCSSLENFQLSSDDDDNDDSGRESEKTSYGKNYFVSCENDNPVQIHNIKTRADNITETEDLSSVEQSIKKEEEEEEEERFTERKSPCRNITAGEVKTEVIQIISGSARSSSRQKNELSRNSTGIASYRCQACRCLFRRQSSEGVDEVDGYRR